MTVNLGANEVVVPRFVLEQFQKLMEGIEEADRTYKACQNTLFRSYVQSAYKSSNCLNAMCAAEEALNAT